MATPVAEKTMMREQTTNNRHLPHDIIRDHILTRIPLKSQIRFGLVCKVWYNSIHTLLFNSIHHHFLVHHESSQNISYPPELIVHDEDYGTINSEVVESCNGVFCVFRTLSHEDANFSFQIFETSINPSKKKKQELMITMTLERIGKAFGFGFDSVTKEHNVAVIQNDQRAGLLCNVYPYNKSSLSRTGSQWLSIGVSPYIQSRFSENSKSAIYWNEVFCWKTQNAREMVLLDLHEENKFRVLAIHDPAI